MVITSSILACVLPILPDTATIVDEPGIVFSVVISFWYPSINLALYTKFNKRSLADLFVYFFDLIIHLIFDKMELKYRQVNY